MKRIWLSAPLTCTLSLSSCMLYNSPKVPPLPAPQHFVQSIPVINNNLKYNWWENFNDSKLNQLVQLALENNNNYWVALKNIDIAQTYVTQNIGNLIPSLSVAYSLSRNQSVGSLAGNFSNVSTSATSSTPTVISSKIYSLSQIYAFATYQVDIWHQIGNSIKQAKMNVAVAKANSNVVKLTLLNSVTSTYFQIQTLNENIINLIHQYQAANEILHLTATQYHSGLVDITVVDDARNQAEIIRSNLQSAKVQRQTLIDMLCYLLGEFPEKRTFVINHFLPHFKYIQLIPPHLPATMIAYRPDIQSTFYQVLSYGYLMKQNIANFLPSVNLTGNDGYLGTTIKHLNGIFWTYGFSLVQSVLNMAENISLYERSRFQYESAIFSYRDAMFNAFKEVDDALANYTTNLKILHNDEQVCLNNQEKLDALRAQYRSGLIDYSTYLTTYLSFLQSEYNLNSQRLLVTMDVIQIYNKLGLGSTL